MITEHWMPADEFCTHYNIEFSFVSSLHEYGLIDMETKEERQFIDTNQLEQLEKFIRLHYDLDINFEGIEAINNLLQRVRSMQSEISLLKNRLRLYEPGE